jgi:hypothetical protein
VTEGAPFSIPSRQRGEELKVPTPVTGLLAASATANSNAVRATGYNAVVGLLLSDAAFTVNIQGASGIRKAIRPREIPGEWTTLETIASSTSGGRQRVVLDHEVRADYIRIQVVNGGVTQTFFERGVRLIPIFSFKQVEVVPSTSGGSSSGVPVVGPAGGSGSGTANASVAVAVSGAPGTDITVQDDTAVGVGVTVALPAIPAGTRRMTVQVTGGDDTTRIRVRDVSGSAGQGLLLSLLASSTFGGADGALEALEVENVAGPAATVAVLCERD